MFLSKTDNRILWLLKILLGSCLAVPLFLSSLLLFPYTSAKAFSFRILVEIAAVFYFYLCLKYPAFRPRLSPPFSKRGSGGILTFAVLLFLLVMVLSAIFGVDFNLSFWGNLERMLGVWGILHFVLYFLMLTSVFQNEKSWINLIKISVGVGVLISLLAIIQRFASVGLLMPQNSRVFGTIGNAGFLGTYLVFNIFFAGYLLARALSNPSQPTLTSKGGAPPLKIRGGWGELFPKLIYSGVILLQIFALLFTQTRGAWLGFLAGLVFILLFAGISKSFLNWRKYALAILVLMFLFAGFIFAFRQSNFVKNNSLLSRFSSISLKETTSQNRLILWQSSWRAWGQKPVFGWGLENFETAINKHFDARLNPFEAWYDRAHNFIFDYGVQNGWLGLLSFLALGAAALFYVKKIAGADLWFSVLFGGLFIAYLTQNFFVFDSFISYLMLFFTLALVVGQYSLSEPSRTRAAGAVEGSIVSPITFFKKLLLLVLVIIVVFSVYVFNVKSISASKLGSRILSLEPQEAGQAEPFLKNVIALKTFGTPEIVYQAVIDYLAKAQAAPALTQDENFYKLTSSRLSALIDKQPEQIRYRVAFAWLNLYFSGQDQTRVEAAISQAQEIKKISPAKKDSYQILVAAYFIKGDSQKIGEQLKEARQKSPELGREVEKFWQGLVK